MKSKLKILNNDIINAISQVSKMPSSDYFKTYSLYRDLYNRYENLDESEFIDYRFYNHYLKHISLYSDGPSVLSELKNADSYYVKDGFPLVVISLVDLQDITQSIITNKRL